MIQNLEQNKAHKPKIVGKTKILMVTSDHREVLTCMNLFKPLETTCKEP